MERRVAGTEVVDRHPCPRGPQAPQRVEQVGVLVGHHALGDLEVEVARTEPVAPGDPGEARLEVAGAQLLRRDVEREPTGGAAPGGAQAGEAGAREVEHVVAERLHQAGLLGEGHEGRRRHRAARRVVPTRERLDPDAAAAVEPHLGLERRLDAGAVAQRGAEVLGQLRPFAHPRVEVGGEVRDRPAAGALGAVHRQVGVRQQRAGVGAVGRGDRHADRRADAHLAAGDRDRSLQGGPDLARDAAGAARGVESGRHDRELVATEPRDRVRAAQHVGRGAGRAPRAARRPRRARRCR